MKRLLLGIILTLLIMAISTISQAKVTGVCSNCHTMHNSQNGQPVARGDEPWGLTGGSGEAIPQLLIASCLGCHSSVGANSIETFDGNKIPIVYNTSQPANPLAGGNFYYVAESEQYYANGHNVAGISPQENPPMDAPPGFKEGVPIPGGTGPQSWSEQLICAGTWGCHGNRTQEKPYVSIYGAHHTAESIDGSTVGRSYRFLYGVLGAEHATWEQGIVEHPATHNGYQGSPNHTSTDTISYLCGECHGDFHAYSGLGGEAKVGSGSPWLRHPTDITLPNEGEYTDYTMYNSIAPVAYTNPTGSETNVGPDSIVMCLSCHRTHGSPNFKLMRWDYRGWPGAGTNGCAICHTSKD